MIHQVIGCILLWMGLNRTEGLNLNVFFLTDVANDLRICELIRLWIGVSTAIFGLFECTPKFGYSPKPLVSVWFLCPFCLFYIALPAYKELCADVLSTDWLRWTNLYIRTLLLVIAISESSSLSVYVLPYTPQFAIVNKVWPVLSISFYKR